MVAASKFPNLPITSHQKDHPGKPLHRKPQRLSSLSLPGFFPHEVCDLVLYTDIRLKCTHLRVELQQPSSRELNTCWCSGQGNGSCEGA